MIREFWMGLSQVSRIFVAIAVPATVVMIIQSLLMLFGIGGGDSDADFEIGGGSDGSDGFDTGGDGSDGDFSLLSVRGLVAFFSIGGWTGVVCDTSGMDIAITAVISFIAGAAALVGLAFLFRAAAKLQGSGNINIENAAGKSGKVYIPIPPKGEGHGKISIMLQGQLIEAEAVSTEALTIPTGAEVTVERVEDGQTLVVKRKII